MAAPNYFGLSQALFDPAAVFRKPEALRGIRVIDLGTIFLGPSTASPPIALGAEVTQVELPAVAEPPAHHRARGLL